jgi:hypothetical protein
VHIADALPYDACSLAQIRVGVALRVRLVVVSRMSSVAVLKGLLASFGHTEDDGALCLSLQAVQDIWCSLVQDHTKGAPKTISEFTVPRMFSDDMVLNQIAAF